MADPVELERRFEELQNRLALTASIRAQLLMIKNFILGYQRDISLYESYISQLSEQIPLVEHPLNIAGIDPVELEKIYFIFNDLIKHYPKLDEIKTFRESLRSLKNYTCFLYACLGAFEKATVILSDDLAGDIGNVTGWSDWIEHLEVATPDLSADIELLQNIRKQATEISDHSVYVPVIEKKAGHSEDEVEKGSRLRRLQVSLERTSGEMDDIQLNIATFGVERDFNSYLSKPLAATRNLINEVAPGIRTHHYRGRISFRSMYSLHEGFSASLAMAGLFYGGMLEASEERVIYKLRSGIAATGDMAENGEIIPVDGQTLDQKVEACFYSWLDVLVVPASQLEEAKAAKERLSLQYPRRKLTVLGVNKLQDLFFDRRISKEIRISRIRRAGHKLWMHKVDVVAVLLVMIMAGVIVALVRKPFDKNPAIADFKGEMMIVKNAEGRELRQIDVGLTTVQRMKGYFSLHNHGYVLMDVNNDGINDIIWGHEPDHTNPESFLICQDGKTGNILWKKKMQFRLDFPNKPEIKNDNYLIYEILADTSHGEKQLYVLVNNQKYFPSLILKINPDDGTILSRLVNAGYLYGISIEDVNGNGSRELVTAGVNNGFREAVLVAFPADSTYGCSPSTAAYKLDGCTVMKSIGMIRIRRSIVGKVLRNVSAYNICKRIQKTDNGFMLRVAELQGGAVDPNFQQSFLLYNLDKKLRVRSIGTSDNYELLALSLKKKGLIKRIPDHHYFESFRKDSLLYWNGKGWQRKPYMPFWKKDRSIVDAESRKSN